MTNEEWIEQEKQRTFEKFFARYGVYDYCVYIRDYGDYGRHKITNWDSGWYRQRCYHDGGWLEGYDIEPVIYWGA
jgi:hypothetical protein